MWPLIWPHLFCLLFCSVLFRCELFAMVFLTLLLDSPSHNPDLLPEPVLLCCVTISVWFSRHHPARFCHYQPSKSFSHVDAVAYWPILSERKSKPTRQPAHRISCPCSMYTMQHLKERESMLPCMSHITLYSTTINEQDDSGPMPVMPSYSLLYSPERCAVVFSAAQAGSTLQTCDMNVA